MLTPRVRGRVQRALLAWGDAHGQDFPWREARNPYWALVAAVASQQTQMARVFPLWERWTSAFPTLEACAAVLQELGAADVRALTAARVATPGA